ncbi:protein of unknown function DUF881 [Beutenbergia cavernae DSM 12333]|uniref:Membrane associated protein n=1 Tax=Beutenbergia cavernae (strain ATCC BAA-8 / DSM 12333 / CCUG 43141 / JCM 11478 / NBRC 16432 / NCIMB 13614 / HKI 0122) TaxID=471853 RepID=C5C6F2_BEUC1|nr:DUF881 domain-containing protein [Beutenbergia cavernae]ACQ80358.1 protein of unknown function DUF881 [Beutenbergia cavernae DSM 12333]
MTLLVEVMEHPLDPAYEDAARRRVTGERERSRGLERALVGVLAVALGVGVVVAARDLRAPAEVTTEARTVLIEEIQTRSGENDVLAETNVDLAAEISDLQEAALERSDPQLVAQLQRLGVASGSSPVHGPGLVIGLTDSDRALAEPDEHPEERVQDADLQVVVNGLWAAGAEAITINGTRVTAISAIRTAGQAILVDLVPLSPPYEVAAIGNTQDLRTRLARTPAAGHLAVLRDQYGIGTSVTVHNDLRMSGASPASLSYAQPVGTTQGGDEQ